MSTDSQLGLFPSPNQVEAAPSCDVAAHDATLSEATATASPETVPSAKRRALANVGPRRKDEAFAPARPQAEERYLSVQDVARRYAVSIQTVWRHSKHNPYFPKPILNGSTRWRMSDILAFEVSRQEASR